MEFYFYCIATSSIIILFLTRYCTHSIFIGFMSSILLDEDRRSFSMKRTVNGVGDRLDNSGRFRNDDDWTFPEPTPLVDGGT